MRVHIAVFDVLLPYMILDLATLLTSLLQTD